MQCQRIHKETESDYLWLLAPIIIQSTSVWFCYACKKIEMLKSAEHIRYFSVWNLRFFFYVLLEEVTLPKKDMWKVDWFIVYSNCEYKENNSFYTNQWMGLFSWSWFKPLLSRQIHLIKLIAECDSFVLWANIQMNTFFNSKMNSCLLFSNYL